VTVEAVGDSAARALFEAVPRSVYARDAVWAPASEMMWRDRFAQLSSTDGAFVRPIVALDRGEAVARCMAILVPGCVDEFGQPQSWIGFFECRESHPQAAAAVLARSEALLRARGACSVLISKADNQLAGVLTAGFSLPHLVFTTHNPPYYLPLLESCGYLRRETLISLYFTREHARSFTLKLPGLRTREFDRRDLQRGIETFHYLQNAIFGNRAGYVARTAAEDRQLVQGLLPFLVDEFVIFAETAAGEPVGLLVCLPDIYQHMQGRAIDRARIITIGAVPGHRARGVGALMAGHLTANLLKHPQYVYAEGSWVRSDNLAPRLLARRFNAQPGREFQLLEKRLR
jgi:hypothetical protein